MRNQVVERGRGFTLIELLIVVGLIGLLLVIAVNYLWGAVGSAKMYREVNAAGGLMQGWRMYASQNNGRAIQGYGGSNAKDDGGNDLGPIISKRYVWRLAPYLDYDLTRTVMVNQDWPDLTEGMTKQEIYMRSYMVSVQPSLGISAQYVGGHEQYAWFPFVRQATAVARPTELIVFASARNGKGSDEKEIQGYYEVRPPKEDEKFDAMGEANKFGFIDLRWNGKTVASMVDGHAETFNEEELRDMRKWSNREFDPRRPNWR